MRWRVCDQMTFMRSASPSIALPAQPARLPTGEGGGGPGIAPPPFESSSPPGAR